MMWGAHQHGDGGSPYHRQVHIRAQPQGPGQMPTAVLQAHFLELGY